MGLDERNIRHIWETAIYDRFGVDPNKNQDLSNFSSVPKGELLGLDGTEMGFSDKEVRQDSDNMSWGSQTNTLASSSDK